MTQDRRRRVEEVYHLALERAPEGRAAFLDLVCSDSELRRQVESLLAQFGGGPVDRAAAEPVAGGRVETGETMDVPAGPREREPVKTAAGSLETQLPEVAGFGPYCIEARLGAGGMGVVYKARDKRLERMVALKALPAGRVADEMQRRRFMHEARAASGLNHPNIITIYDIVSDGDENYIAMEYVEGRTLRDLAGPPGNKPADVASLIPIFRQVAEGMAASHAAGIVHRDIKPENIMIRDDGYVKILDFGLARLTSMPAPEEDSTVTGITAPGTVMGTARYMSPEQVRGEPLDSSSDVFSMGLVFYELATGSYPFPVGSQQRSMYAIATETPLTPSLANPEVPAPLEALIVQMLSKDKLLRPSAATVKAELSALGQNSAATLAPVHRLTRARGVGRHAELEQLRLAFASVSGGNGVVVCVAGEAGIGKTTLAEDFLSELEARYASCFLGRGHGSERLGETDAYLPIVESLERLLRGDGGDQAARLMRTVAPTWYLQVAPSLGDKTQETLAKEVKTASHERMRRELAAFFEELSRIRPVVLLFDDVHWSDTSTCDLIAYLGPRLPGIRLLLLATYRPGALQAAKHPFLRVKVELARRGVCRDLPLSFLDRTEIERYVALQFPRHRLPSEFFQVIHEKTEGNPLFMADMLRYLRDRNALLERDGHWTLVQPIAEVRKEIPATIRSMIQLKIDQFTDAERTLMLAAAVEGVQFDSAVLANVLSLDAIEVEERLQKLETVYHFIRIVSEQELPNRGFSLRCQFQHVFYQNALYASLAPSRRAALSLSVAQALIALWGDKVLTMAAEVAFLFESARAFANASVYFYTASRNAARVFAYPEAVILCERGMRALATQPESLERDRHELAYSLTLGISLMATRGYAVPEVERTHLRSRELCLKLNETRRLFPVLWGLHTYYLIGGRMREALVISEEMQSLVGAIKDPIALIESLHSMATTLSFIGRLRESRVYSERIFAAYSVEQDVFHGSLYVLDPLVSALSVLARTLTCLGFPDQGMVRARQSATVAERLAHPQSLAYATFWIGWVHFTMGENELACRYLEPAMALSREHGLPQILEWGRIVRGSALARQGNAAEGIPDMRKSLANQLAMNSRLDRAYCLTLLAEALLSQGELDEPLALIGQALETAESSGEHHYIPEMFRIRGEIHLARGDSAAAEREFQEAIELARRTDCRLLELRAAASWLRAGTTAAARYALSQALAWFTEGTGAPQITAARKLLALAAP